MIAESLSIKEGLAGGVGQKREKSPQIGLLSHAMEHLRDTEVVDVVALTVLAACADVERFAVVGEDNVLSPLTVGVELAGREGQDDQAEHGHVEREQVARVHGLQHRGGSTPEPAGARMLEGGGVIARRASSRIFSATRAASLRSSSSPGLPAA